MLALAGEDVRRCVGFGVRDEENVRALAGLVTEAAEAVIGRFHDRLMADAQVRQMFSGGAAQVERVRATLVGWLRELVGSPEAARQWAWPMGAALAHVRAGVGQEYLLVGVEVLWQELRQAVLAAGASNAAEKLDSLHKLLTLQAALLTEAYQECYASQVRHEERSVAEERLTRSEHLATLGQAAASLAHEIKNPLAGISGAIQVLRDGMEPGDPRREIMREITVQIDRLDTAVKDLLIYARPPTPTPVACDLSALVSRTLSVIRQAQSLQDVEVALTSKGGGPIVQGDAGQLEQLVMNLVYNAAHASPAGGRIEIELSETAEGARIVVADHGQGMSEAVLARAFEPFFTTRAKGTGLGLPICRRIVESHGGSIDLESREGQGTRVTVELKGEVRGEK